MGGVNREEHYASLRNRISGVSRPERAGTCDDVSLSEEQNAREQLWHFIETEHPQDAGIVYCLSREKVESIAIHDGTPYFPAIFASKYKSKTRVRYGLPSSGYQTETETELNPVRADVVILL